MAPKLPGGNAFTAISRVGFAETAAAVAALAAAFASIVLVPGIEGWLGAGLGLLMLAIATVDFRYLIIPNELSAAALVLAIVDTWLAAVQLPESLAIGALRGAATMFFFWMLRWLYSRLRGREGLGLGDVKLAFVAGAWLDWTMIPIAIEIAALAALAVYILSHIFGPRPLDMTSRLPLGVFLAPSIWLAWLLGKLLFFA